MSLRRLVAAALIPLALLASACGGGEGESFGDDSLVIYSGRNENLVGPLIEKLRTATGLDVQVRYGDSAELAAQILEEGADTRADLFFSQDAGALGALSKHRMLAPIAPAALDRVPAEYRGSDGTWVGLSGRSRVIVYDPRTVTAPPKSVFELTDPRWQGKVGWAPTNASFQSFVTALRVLSGEDRARQWLEAMKANGTQTFSNNVNILNAVDEGKLQLGLINHYYWYEKVAERGANGVPSRLAYLPGGDPGALVNVAGVGVLKDSEHAAAAHKAVDFLLGTEAQKYFADTTKEYPLISGVATAAGLPPFDSLKGPEVDLSKLDSIEQTITLLQEVGLV
ncbi:iron ABC transporter substrate-binding protein [Planomonospora venezuelensis]|uniref:Iron(III) transport system substrate-binding protein n=1 Tax=Planomonospora venezuelensis TaxID=1999 RepID=A0A841CZV1_PLAVE|nr:iron ABC transporter substrate-binding protein [Planomonospora venezuelensis]MBB5963000.1 iron(III) transport system substrate-binding protein [Planomonospora venezuelensis]GIN00568.1 iron ABC transporter substrate-binding protein [Planomonospora venezuelensis]